MSLPDYTFLESGVPITWKASGGDKAITLTSLANNSYRQGEKSPSLIDATRGMPEVLNIRLESSVAAQTTATGKEIKLFIAESDHATSSVQNPGNLTGLDEVLNYGAEVVSQLNYAGSLVVASGLTTAVQRQRFDYFPVCPYIIPVVHNDTGQALGSTAGDHQIVMTPYYRKIAE